VDSWLNWHKVSAQTSKSCIVKGSKKFIPKMINNDTLEMLMQREQLIEDIDAIVDQFTFDLPIDDIHERCELAEELTRILCDAVCKNFPTK
jgi:hypothetical protein